MAVKGDLSIRQLSQMSTVNNPKFDGIRNHYLRKVIIQHVHESQRLEASVEEKVKNTPLDMLQEVVKSDRSKFLEHCGNVIVYDSTTSCHHNIEYFLWKTAFYSLIERLRKHLNDQRCKYKAEQLFKEYIDEVYLLLFMRLSLNLGNGQIS